MHPVIILLISLASLSAIYLILIAPRIVKRADMSAFSGRIIAHRGMFYNPEIPENSMASFRNAIEHGYGIEMDIHKIADGSIVVHHDSTLERSCNIDKAIADCTYDELLAYPLFGTSERIPLFSDFLALVDGKVPLIIELKGTSVSDTSLADEAYKILKDYKGDYCIESFNPMLVARWRKLAPRDATGLLMTDYRKNEGGKNRKYMIFNSFIQNVLVRPDFIAYELKYDGNAVYRLVKRLFKPYTAAWTVRTKDEFDRCRKSYDTVICENLGVIDVGDE